MSIKFLVDSAPPHRLLDHIKIVGNLRLRDGVLEFLRPVRQSRTPRTRLHPTPGLGSNNLVRAQETFPDDVQGAYPFHYPISSLN